MEENLKVLKELLEKIKCCDDCPLKMYCDFVERESFEGKSICESLGFSME